MKCSECLYYVENVTEEDMVIPHEPVGVGYCIFEGPHYWAPCECEDWFEDEEWDPEYYEEIDVESIEFSEEIYKALEEINEGKNN